MITNFQEMICTLSQFCQHHDISSLAYTVMTTIEIVTPIIMDSPNGVFEEFEYYIRTFKSLCDDISRQLANTNGAECAETNKLILEEIRLDLNVLLYRIINP